MAKAIGDNGDNPSPLPPDTISPPAPKEAFCDTKPKAMTVEEACGVARSSVSVPCNVYGGAAFCGILQETQSLDRWLQRCGEAYTRLLLNHAIQVALLLGLAQLNSWQNVDIDTAPGKQCWSFNWWFYIPCVWVFVASIMSELIDTVDMCDLIIFRVPTLEGSSEILKYATGEDGSLSLVSGGMSKCRKVFVSIAILLPRFALAIAMLTVGGYFLLSAGSNTNLLMNCLAANFILDSDELIFAFLTPAKTQRLIESIPPFETDESSPIQLFLMRFSFITKLFLSSLAVFLMYLTGPECSLDPCEDSKAQGRSCPIF